MERPDGRAAKGLSGSTDLLAAADDGGSGEREGKGVDGQVDGRTVAG
jgi:hypothetical protein